MDYQEYVTYEPLLARRASAAMLDYVLFFAICYGYIRLVGTETEPGTYQAQGLHHFVLLGFLWFVYFPIVEGIFGYTLFKGLFDIKLVLDRKRDSRFGASLKRHLLDPLDFAFFGAVAIILVKTRNDHKRLGDMVAYSHIVLDKGHDVKEATHPSESPPQQTLPDGER
jgi:uncharacterized RDD family membrane protein YckC